MDRFRDRQQAGERLAERLVALGYGREPQVLVFALPRGGVLVAHPIAQRLGAPLDVWVVRKLGVPGHEELALGAIAAGGGRVLNEEVIRGLGIPAEAIAQVEACETQELLRRERLYRGERPPPELGGKVVLLVDDGLATGATMKAAIAAARAQRPARLVVAVPVAPPEALREMEALADTVVCLKAPPDFRAVGLWYERFPQVSDEEVLYLLRVS